MSLGVDLLLIVSGLGAGAVVLFGGRGIASSPAHAPATPVRPTDSFDPRADRKKALEVVERSQTVRLLGETEEREIRSTITLAEMTEDSNKGWQKTGVTYRALELAGNVYIFRIPKREGGDDVWIKASRLDSPMPMMDFFKGDDSHPGPARQFKNNGQTTPVPFQLPAPFGDTTAYKLTDIGRFEATVDGEGKQFLTGDDYPFVTAFTADGTGILVYLDSRKGMARGTGGLFRGEIFEPEVDIASLL